MEAMGFEPIVPGTYHCLPRMVIVKCAPNYFLNGSGCANAP